MFLRIALVAGFLLVACKPAVDFKGEATSYCTQRHAKWMSDPFHKKKMEAQEKETGKPAPARDLAWFVKGCAADADKQRETYGEAALVEMYACAKLQKTIPGEVSKCLLPMKKAHKKAP